MENSISFNELSIKYLAWCNSHRSPRTKEWYTGHLDNFLLHLGDSANHPAMSMKPYHVVEWVDSKPRWGNTYKRGAIVAIQRVYNFAEEMGYLSSNPIKKTKKPPAGRRDNHMQPQDYQNILCHLPEGDPFRDIVVFAWNTGCRPQEVRAIEPRHVFLDRECITFPALESKGKRYPRTIYLHGEALEIIKRRMAKYPKDKLFRNTWGGAWTKYAICNRMFRLSKLTGKRMALYDIRHGFATRKIVQGHNHMAIAALLGHRDGSMLAKVYSHVDKDTEHLKRVLVG